MKKVLAFALTAMTLAACQPNSYTIHGSIQKEDADVKWVYLYPLGEEEPVDSALVQDGLFQMKGQQDKAALYSLRPEMTKMRRVNAGLDFPYTATFVLENAELDICLNQVSTVKGTPANDARTAFQGGISSLYDEMMEVYHSEKEQSEIMKEADALQEKINALAKAYLEDNKGDLNALYTLYQFRYNLPEDFQMPFYENVEETYGEQPWLAQQLKHIEARKAVAVGNPFLDFKMNDLEGNEHALSEWVGNGKVAVIDFWASWCPPCRADMPNMVNIYQKYKDQGFELIGISLDSEKEKWENGIEKLNITWPQLSDLKGWKNAGAQLYGVNSIPSTVLVDKDGKIVAHNLHGEELEAEIEKLLK